MECSKSFVLAFLSSLLFFSSYITHGKYVYHNDFLTTGKIISHDSVFRLERTLISSRDPRLQEQKGRYYMANSLRADNNPQIT